MITVNEAIDLVVRNTGQLGHELVELSKGVGRILAEDIAADMDMPIAFIEKRRHGNDAKAEALTLIGEVKDRDVIIVDDEVDTGGSIAQAVDVVKRNGARDVYLAFIHPVLSANGAARLASLPIKQIITTDSTPLSAEKLKVLEGKLTILSISTLLGEVIRRAHEGRSVGEMFNE